ncbi:MAG: hypothetical protein ACI4MN_04650 [Candidatus Coproplasma sp.]
MASTLCVGIDLGCDTLKLSYAYSDGTKTIYGKLEENTGVKQVAIPAVAYFDGDKWVFGNEVEMGEEKSFVNIVKIKALLSLLYPKPDCERGKEIYPNEKHYYENDHFPKFYFPTTNRTLENFPSLIDSDRTFRAEGYTPRKVCELFFKYVKGIIVKAVNELAKRTGQEFNLKFSVVHPMYAGDKYVSELGDLVYKVFGVKPAKIMDSARALSMFAAVRGVVKDDEGILLFDMGEETISVVKSFINGKGKVVVEAAIDHSDPEKIGGNDVDFNIATFIEDTIKDRETVGSPSAGDSGHIHEEGLQSKQYLFLKEIKKAKMMLSISSLNGLFEGGVPVSIHRDLYIQRTLTKEDLMRCVGMSGNDKVAKRVLDYIVAECELAVNDDVSKIILTGGLAETYGFVQYLKIKIAQALKGRNTKIEVYTFDDYKEDGDRLTIQSHEDSVYAPSVGAAIVALKNYDVSAGLTYSYGTYTEKDGKRFLEIFADRGSAYNEKKESVFSTGSLTLYRSVDEEFFTVRLSQSSIDKRKAEGEVEYYTIDGKNYLVIGEPGTRERMRAERKFQLKSIFGSQAKICCKYLGRPIDKIPSGLKMREGIIIKPHGSEAVPFIENLHVTSFSKVIYSGGYTGFIDTGKIELYFTGVKNFNVIKS